MIFRKQPVSDIVRHMLVLIDVSSLSQGKSMLKLRPGLFIYLGTRNHVRLTESDITTGRAVASDFLTTYEHKILHNAVRTRLNDLWDVRHNVQLAKNKQRLRELLQ